MNNQLSMSDRLWTMHSPLSTGSAPKRSRTFLEPFDTKSLELARELLLIPFVAFTRTSVYSNSKLKRNAVHLDSVIEELKRHRLLIIVRQGVQMIDGTRRRVDLLVKCPPIDHELSRHVHQPNNIDDDLLERLGRFSVDYHRYIQTLGTIDIGNKYRLSEQCYDLLNSSDYKRYLTVDLERLAPLQRMQQSTNPHTPIDNNHIDQLRLRTSNSKHKLVEFDPTTSVYVRH
jgi:hypothetical protein